jgi:membrane protease YdiL (CAAX protease family)
MTAMPRFAPPFDRFVAPARASAELWRTGVGLCLALAIYSGLGVGAFLLAERLGADLDLLARNPTSLLFFLGTFIGMAAGPIIVVRLLHRRPSPSLWGRAAWVLRDFVLAVALAAPLFGLSVALWQFWFDPLPGLAPDLWWRLLPLSLIAVALQTGAEELLFRGYLQQQLAARFASPLAWMVVPSLLFGYAHFNGALPLGVGLTLVAGTALFGLIAADLTARTGSIGAAWGLHFANNVLALLLLATAGPLDGLALFVTPYGLDTPMLGWLILADAAVLLLVWLVLARALAR